MHGHSALNEEIQKKEIQMTWTFDGNARILHSTNTVCSTQYHCGSFPATASQRALKLRIRTDLAPPLS